MPARLIPLNALLVGLCSALRQSLLKRSNLPVEETEPLEAMLGVPANANSNQRFLTTDMFRQRRVRRSGSAERAVRRKH